MQKKQDNETPGAVARLFSKVGCPRFRVRMGFKGVGFRVKDTKGFLKVAVALVVQSIPLKNKKLPLTPFRF